MPAPEAVAAPAYTCDSALTALFTPLRPLAGRYEVCTTPATLEAAIAGNAERLRDEAPAPQSGWLEAHVGAIEALEALEAFGAAGGYQRSALARLYGGTRTRVARGWSRSADRLESITFLSPYPDPSLSRLMPGTMAIRFTLQSPREP